jgi:ABC-type branched-subunit amino acid transport system ATPase component
LSLAFSRAAFAILPAVVSTIIPYRLRSRGIALLGIYLFLFGAFFGAVLTGVLSDSLGDRTALTIVVLPATLIGGALIAYGARYVRRDISMVVEELTEEQQEQQRLALPEARVPVLQVRNLDFSYGKVQVLFDVAFEVHRGEVLALLGTNGAGKSTILRVISGLGVAERGVVRLNGRTITYADPELRAKVGIVSLAGGKATFGSLSLEENLRMAAFRYGKTETDERIDRVVEMFPVLRERFREPAALLSGGQQQMLALAMALMHDPEILLIDELSLGLSPIVVQELLTVVERLKESGMTMVIVEQSLNVALSVSDRAIFLEKGQIRFEGPARELLERDDLARAVFLGAEQG